MSQFFAANSLPRGERPALSNTGRACTPWGWL